MPPKKLPGSPKAKGKMTKAERERLKKEEELQRQREEEESRRRAIEEEKDRIEREKQDAERRRRLLIEERKRKAGQVVALDGIWNNNRQSLLQELREDRKRAQWERYLRCDGSPDPTIEAEINTYMNLWRENKEDNTIDTTLTEADLVLSLIGELDYIVETYPAEEITEKEFNRYKQTGYELTVLLQEKLDLASHDLLLRAHEYADSETSNLEFTINNDVITLCMWGNLSKNPRIRSFEFEEKGVQFDIPKILALSDCAFRILFTKYDHQSPQCITYKPRKKVKPPPEILCEEAGAEGDPSAAAEEGGASGAGPPVTPKETEKEKAERKEKEEAARKEAELREKKLSLFAKGKDRQNQEQLMAQKKAATAAEEELQKEEQEWDIKTPEPDEWEDFDEDDDVVDLRAYAVLGGVFHFNLLHLPPQPRIINNWMITQVIEPAELAHMEYIGDQGMSAPSSAKESTREEGGGGGGGAPKKEERPPIGVTIKLPDGVSFSEEPQVVRWDPIRKLWSLDGFSDHDYKEDTRIISFKTCEFGTFALIQDCHINMPFQSWEIRPREKDAAVFTIIAAIVEVEIEIKGAMCKLNVPEKKLELQHFKNKWMTPRELIKALRGAGLNVFPAPDSNRYVSIQNKSPVTEERLYQQMALTSSAMAFSWSKWNSEVKNREQILLQGAEHLVDEPLAEEEWSLLMATKYRTIKLRMTEFDENFSEDPAEGTEYHADLYHTSMELVSDEGKRRITDTTNKFVDSVYTLLKAARIITYS